MSPVVRNRPPCQREDLSKAIRSTQRLIPSFGPQTLCSIPPLAPERPTFVPFSSSPRTTNPLPPVSLRNGPLPLRPWSGTLVLDGDVVTKCLKKGLKARVQLQMSPVFTSRTLRDRHPYHGAEKYREGGGADSHPEKVLSVVPCCIG